MIAQHRPKEGSIRLTERKHKRICHLELDMLGPSAYALKATLETLDAHHGQNDNGRGRIAPLRAADLRAWKGNDGHVPAASMTDSR